MFHFCDMQADTNAPSSALTQMSNFFLYFSISTLLVAAKYICEHREMSSIYKPSSTQGHISMPHTGTRLRVAHPNSSVRKPLSGTVVVIFYSCINYNSFVHLGGFELDVVHSSLG